MTSNIQPKKIRTDKHDPRLLIGEPLYVLSIREPHMSAILRGEKWTENRTWSTAIRGRILLHRSGGPERDRGVVGSVDLTDCVEIGEGCTREGIAFSRSLLDAGMPRAGLHHIEGPFCLVVRNAIRFPAVLPISGRLGFWRASIELDNAGNLIAQHAAARPVSGGPVRRNRKDS